MMNTHVKCGCLKGSVGLVDTQIRGTVGIICTPNTGVYLRITPTTIWLLEDIDTADVDVITNIEWIVK